MKNATGTVARIWESPIGPLGLSARDGLLRAIDLNPDPRDFPPPGTAVPEPQWLEPVEAQLAEYFAGERRKFDLPLDLGQGTEFQRTVWHELLFIPYGTTCSYGDIAGRLGLPGAMRAVGGANHANPIPIIVPCHRVVQSNGSLGGFGGGLEMKRRLLALEGAGTAYMF